MIACVNCMAMAMIVLSGYVLEVDAASDASVIVFDR